MYPLMHCEQPDVPHVRHVAPHATHEPEPVGASPYPARQPVQVPGAVQMPQLVGHKTHAPPTEM